MENGIVLLLLSSPLRLSDIVSLLYRITLIPTSRGVISRTTPKLIDGSEIGNCWCRYFTLKKIENRKE